MTLEESTDDWNPDFEDSDSDSDLEENDCSCQGICDCILKTDPINQPDEHNEPELVSSEIVPA